MPERYWLTFTTRHRHGPPTQELVYYQREGPERWRLYYGKAGRRRSVGTDSTRMVEYQVDLARSEGRFIRHEPDQAEQGRMFNPLVRGYSRGAISENISREMHGGRAQDQAVAIALDVGRRAYRSRHPRGPLPAQLRRNPAVPTIANPQVACPFCGYIAEGPNARRLLREHVEREHRRYAPPRRFTGRGRARRRRNPWYVRRQRTRDRSQRAEMFGESEVGRVQYSRTFPKQAAAEREAAAWRSTGDWAASVHEGRAPSRRRNPSPRVVYSRLLGGWYVVVGRQQTPISGRFNSKAAALEWLRRRNPTDIEPMPDKPNRYLLRDRETGRIVASGKDQRTAIRFATDRDVAERRRRPARRRNPMGHGEWIDVVVPLVALFVLIRGGVLRVGHNTPSAAAPRP